MGRPKKEKLTKAQKNIKAYREERLKTSAKRKRTIIPGPWTLLETKLALTPTLKANSSIYSVLGPFYGIYRDDSNWNEKGWYPISINILLPDLQALVQTHGLDQVLAAAEIGLNKILDENHKKSYGHIILLSVFSDNSQNPDPIKRFISCWAKTNKKSVVGFLATRKGELTVLKADLKPEELELQINQ